MFGRCLEKNYKLCVYARNYGTTELVARITILSPFKENESRYGHTQLWRCQRDFQ